jgi:hypothetical protein
MYIQFSFKKMMRSAIEIISNKLKKVETKKKVFRLSTG